MTKLFAVVNGRVIESLGDNTTPTYTRIHYLLNELKKFDGIEVMSISFDQLSKKGWRSILYNNAIKTTVALRSALILIKSRPMVFFAYPHSLTTVQNRAIFRLCELLNLKIVLDIHDTIEQVNAIGTGKALLSKAYECHCFRESTILLTSLDGTLWRELKEAYGIPGDKKIVYLPNAFDEDFIKYYPEPYKSQANRFNICYLGGLTKNRGIELLVQACSDLHKAYPQLRLLLFGAYGEGISEEIKKLISESDFVTQMEVPRMEIPKSLGDIDLFVMPYNPNEPYMSSITPVKFFEYIGTGKPILCTKCESLKDIGADGGIMYVDYELGDFKSKIEILINSPKLREDMSKQLFRLREKNIWKERASRLYEMLRNNDLT